MEVVVNSGRFGTGIAGDKIVQLYKGVCVCVFERISEKEYFVFV